MSINGWNNSPLPNGYTLYVIPSGQESPRTGHLANEVVVDEENMRMYAWGAFVAASGLDCVLRACDAWFAKVNTTGGVK